VISFVLVLALALVGTVFAEAAPAAPGNARAQRAKAAGEAAATKAGSKVAVPKETVGHLEIYGASDGGVRVDDALKKATAILGWDLKTCDGQGDPTKMAACGESLLNQNVNLIVSTGIESAIVKPELERAKQEGVLWINFAAAVSPSPLFTASYPPKETDMTKLLDDYMIKQLNRRSGKSKQIGAFTFPAVVGLGRRGEQLKRDVKGTKVQIVDDHNADLANLAQDTQRATDAMLTANPSLDGIWASIDVCLPIVAQSVATQFSGKNYPKRPLVVGFLDEKPNLQAIRDHKADALATFPLADGLWIVLDQAAEFFARHTPITKQNAFENSKRIYGLDFSTPALITIKNVPKGANSQWTPPEDTSSFFKAKWAKEFTT
jgi:ABC-type sugar transport system substrate-binding protein